ncbi:hypothetical protein MMC10_008280 [Thelotrema lepadinum]|nr:hypothetical protein [Thelotrema lepadinum]
MSGERDIDNDHAGIKIQRRQRGITKNSGIEWSRRTGLPAHKRLPSDRSIDRIEGEDGKTASQPVPSAISLNAITSLSKAMSSLSLDDSAREQTEVAGSSLSNNFDLSTTKLLSLPPEIVNQIFAFTLISPRQPLPISLSRLRTRRAKHPLNLLLTSRCICSIALPIYYAHNTFYLDSPAQLFHFLGDLAPQRRAAIRSMHVGGFGYDPMTQGGGYLNSGDIVRNAFVKLGLCGGLRELTIEMLMGCGEIFWQELAAATAQVRDAQNEWGPQWPRKIKARPKGHTIPTRVIGELDSALNALSISVKGLKKVSFRAARTGGWGHFLRQTDTDEHTQRIMNNLVKGQEGSSSHMPISDETLRSTIERDEELIKVSFEAWKTGTHSTVNVGAKDRMRDRFLRAISEMDMEEIEDVDRVNALKREMCESKEKFEDRFLRAMSEMDMKEIEDLDRFITREMCAKKKSKEENERSHIRPRMPPGRTKLWRIA